MLALTSTVALVIGLASPWLLERLIARERRLLGEAPVAPHVARLRPVIVLIVGGSLIAGQVYGELVLRLLETPEVQPSDLGRQWRALYHALLVLLLVLATTIDFDCYLIPDEITFPGLVLGLLGAVTLQELQIAHLWVDWAAEIPGVHGPYIPAWYDQFRWAHALAWSVAGAACGAVVTQGTRLLSSRLLGQEAMGFGDVTLMAMIGSFVGWQAVLILFTIAPLVGLVLAAASRLSGSPRWLPYGPCLAAATLITLFSWSWLWPRVRLFFSDIPAIITLGAIAMLTLTVLLRALRLLRLRR